MARTQLFAPLIFLTAAACGHAGAPSASKNIFGTDDRVLMPDAQPYRAIGRLDSGCTGALVGKRLVLTAAHCVYDSASHAVKTDVKYFRPNLRGGQSAHKAWIEAVWIASAAPEADRLKDYALVRVDQDLGGVYGTLAVTDAGIEGAALPYPVALAGYSTDRANGDDPSLAPACAVRELVEGKLFNDCDAAAGISGAPLLSAGAPAVVGLAVSEYRLGAATSVHRDEYSRDYANVAIPASAFAAAVTRALAAVDGPSAGGDVDGLSRQVNPNQRDPGDPGPGGGTDYFPLVLPLSQLAYFSSNIHGTNDALMRTADRLSGLARNSSPKLAEATGRLRQGIAAFDYLIQADFFNHTAEDDGRREVAARYGELRSAADAVRSFDEDYLPPWVRGGFEQGRFELTQGLQRLTPYVLHQ